MKKYFFSELFAVSCRFGDAVVVTSFNLVAVHRKLSGKRNLDWSYNLDQTKTNPHGTLSQYESSGGVPVKSLQDSNE